MCSFVIHFCYDIWYIYIYNFYLTCMHCIFWSLCRVCELLQGGAVMNKSFQPHEAHIPFLLQLFIDYNLYGMNMINLAAVKFRKSHATGNADSYLCTWTAIIATINKIHSSLVDDTTEKCVNFGCANLRTKSCFIIFFNL